MVSLFTRVTVEFNVIVPPNAFPTAPLFPTHPGLLLKCTAGMWLPVIGLRRVSMGRSNLAGECTDLIVTLTDGRKVRITFGPRIWVELVLGVVQV